MVADELGEVEEEALLEAVVGVDMAKNSIKIALNVISVTN
jgi:hypothetical protein